MIRTLIVTLAGLAMAAAALLLPAAAASASTGPCPDVYLWANPVVNHAPLFCFANEAPGTTFTPPE
jgi:hypothetical protein